jgi:hypothetical protein
LPHAVNALQFIVEVGFGAMDSRHFLQALGGEIGISSAVAL